MHGTKIAAAADDDVNAGARFTLKLLVDYVAQRSYRAADVVDSMAKCLCVCARLHSPQVAQAVCVFVCLFLLLDVCVMHPRTACLNASDSSETRRTHTPRIDANDLALRFAGAAIIIATVFMSLMHYVCQLTEYADCGADKSRLAGSNHFDVNMTLFVCGSLAA